MTTYANEDEAHMRTLRRTMRGAAAVELALVAIPLVFMAVAALDFARAVFTYNQLAKSVRDGARFLSGFDPTVAAEYPTASAKQRMVYGSATGTTPIVAGLTTGMISVCDRVESSACPGESFANVATGSGSINLVKVTITGYTFTPVFPGISKLTSVIFEPISATMRQVL